MNRRPDAPDPLSPEERELAQRLLRLGPSDGPSPALDARILAAAHAAVATTPPRLRARPKQRWPMWIGVAASLSLAVGIAWQLRPAATTMEAAQQEQDAAVVARAQVEPVAGSGGVQSADAQAEAPAAAAAADSVAAPQPPAELLPPSGLIGDRAADAAAPAAMKPAPVAEAVPPAPPKAAAAEAAKRSRAEAPPSVQADAASDERAPEQLRRVQAPPAERELRAAPAMAPPPPPPPPPASSAPMGVMSAPAPIDAAPAANAARATPADNLSSKRAAKAAATSAAAANAATLGKSEAYSERAVIQAAPEPSSQRDASSTLDRVEVTGSRIGNDASDETRLAPAEWLDRIRGYRDDGQAERARESLQRFRRAHPHARVPDDLRALLK